MGRSSLELQVSIRNLTAFRSYTPVNWCMSPDRAVHQKGPPRNSSPMSLLDARRALIFLIAALVPTASASSWVQGTVWEHREETRRPLAKVYLAARTLRGRLLASTRTSANGTFQLQDLPAQRLVLTAWKSGYYTDRAARRSGKRVTLDCTLGCAQEAIDFELVRGAVLEGVVLDRQGEPVERAQVSARRIGSDVSIRRGNMPRASTDDRGHFRLAGLPPGPYSLTVRGRAPAPAETATLLVEPGESEVIDDLAITLGEQSAHDVSGRLVGLGLDEAKRVQVRLQVAENVRQVFASNTDAEGRFHLTGVPSGRYLAKAVISERGAGRRQQFLDILDIYGDVQGLVLRPGPSSTVEGVARLAAEPRPRQVRLELQSNEGFGRRLIPVDPADGRFQIDDLIPGSYRLGVRPSAVYVESVQRGSMEISPEDLTVSAGSNRFDVILAADHGQVYGTVHEPTTGRPLPHARVALDGDRGRLRVQSDQAGRFLFGKVIPGEYRICAWTDIAPEQIADENEWEQAGCENKIIPVDPESEVEIDLTAAP